ncbi:MAG: DUF308 domain-containing protein [Lachnospiraceae bacterium]|nr:DUF308 domain-containing protein [Lachnospiraceae bacterium]
MRKKEEKVQEDVQAKKSTSLLGPGLICIMSLLLAGIGAILLFVPQITVEYICYTVCGVVIIVGIYMIVHYFMTDAYRNLNAYGFSEGTLLVALGICGLLRISDLVAVFYTVMALVLILCSVVQLQSALDLRRMGDVLWILFLILSAALLICSMVMLINPFEDPAKQMLFCHYLILIGGALGLINMIYLAIRLKIYEKSKKKKEQKAENQLREDVRKELEEEAGASPQAKRTAGAETDAQAVAPQTPESEETHPEEQTAGEASNDKSDFEDWIQ